MTEHGGSLTFHTLIKNHVKFLKFQPYVTEFARKKNGLRQKYYTK